MNYDIVVNTSCDLLLLWH